MSSARLKYKVVKCSSEDPEYPVSELLAHSSQTKGWQTAKFCDFPQELGLQFETPVHLRQVQFLSHQSKIATKIELFTALPAEGQPARYEGAQFKRLGYLSLDSNERSQFQARELKSVYVDVAAQFLRILLHKCHVNRYNIVNQVGLIALNCLGESAGAPSPEAPISVPSPSPSNHQRSASGSTPAASPAQPPSAEQIPRNHQRSLSGPEPARSAPAEPRPAPATAQAAPPSDEGGLDEQTAERIRALEKAKAQAVDREDYEEAKRCKEMVVRLRQTSQLVRELEERKRQAVEDEDYDAAKALKVEIDRLRDGVERPESGGQRPGGRTPPADRNADRQPDRQADRQARESPPPNAQQAGPRGARQPMMAKGGPQPGPDADSFAPAARAVGPSRSPPGPAAGQDADPYGPSTRAPRGKPASATASTTSATPSAQERSPSGSPASARDVPTFGGSDGYRDDMPPMPRGFDHGMREGAAFGASPPSNGGGGGRGQLARTGDGVARSPLGAMAGGAPPAPPERTSSGQSIGSSGHPLRGVPNADELGQPDPLPVNFEKETDPLKQIFGDYLTRCVFSKSWNLRDAAIQKLTLDLRNGEVDDQDPSRLLHGYAIVLKRTIPDKAVQVFLSSGGLLQELAQNLLEMKHFKRERANVEQELDPLMPLLVDRLGDANARITNLTRDAWLDFARCANVGAPFATQYLLKPPKNKKSHARVYSSRLQLLAAIASEAGVQPASKEGVPLDETMRLAMDWFSNPTAEVRESAVKLVAACCLHVGLPKIEKYLANLRPAQREVFDAEFLRSRGGGGTPSPSTSAPSGGGRGPGRLGDEDDYAPPTQASRQPSPQATTAPRQNGQAQRAAERPPERAPAPAQEEFDDGYDDEYPEFTCQFCGRQDPSFTPEQLDVHYWRECPMLIECEFCAQVIEISTLRDHLREECEMGAPARQASRNLEPGRCPLCNEGLGNCEDLDWQDHLLQMGCPRNPRNGNRPRLR